MTITDTDLRDALAPMRELEPTPAEIERVLAEAREVTRPRHRPARAVAVVATAAAIAGALAALPGGDATHPRDAHGILEAAAAAAAQQPAPLAYRYTRVLDRFVNDVNAGAEHGRVVDEQTSENWTADGFRGRTTAPQGTTTWDSPPSPALRRAVGFGSIVKGYDGDFRYGDGPLAEVRFAELPTDPGALARLLDAAIRDLRWSLRADDDRAPKGYRKPSRWAPGYPKQWQVDEEVIHSAVLLLSLGNLSGAQRQALFELLADRPGARALGEVKDATGRSGVGVALTVPPGRGADMRVIIDPKTSDILQISEGTAVTGPPAKRPAGAPKDLPWPPPVALVEREQVFLSTGSVAALGERP